MTQFDSLVRHVLSRRRLSGTTAVSPHVFDSRRPQIATTCHDQACATAYTTLTTDNATRYSCDLDHLIRVKATSKGVPNMRGRTAFGLELGLAATLGGIAALTLIWGDWLEAVFGVDPDRHSGSLEWSVVAALTFAAISVTYFAHREWRRLEIAS
jgi:hypothetical protein